MYCPQCGNEELDGSMFCSECGARIASQNAEATTEAPTSADQHSNQSQKVAESRGVSSDAEVASDNSHNENPSKKGFSAGKWVVSIIAVVVAVAVGLFAAGNIFNSADDNFIGTWETTVQQKDGILTVNVTYTLDVMRTDHTWKITTSEKGRWLGTNFGESSNSGKWTISGNNIVLETTGTEKHRYVLSLSNDKTKLRDESDGGSLVFSKK